MLLADVAAASVAVAAVPGRTAKTQLLAGCLRTADDRELPVVVAWLAGQPRQRRTGSGWASLRLIDPFWTPVCRRTRSWSMRAERFASALAPG